MDELENEPWTEKDKIFGKEWTFQKKTTLTLNSKKQNNQQTEISVVGLGKANHLIGWETPVVSCYQKVAGPMHEMLSHETPAGLAWILKVFNIEVSSVFEFVAVPCVSPQKMDKKWKLTCLAGTWTI